MGTQVKAPQIADGTITQAKMRAVPIVMQSTVSGGDWTSASSTPVTVATLNVALLSGITYTIIALGSISCDGNTVNDNINSVISIGGNQSPNVGSARVDVSGNWKGLPVSHVRTGQSGTVAVLLQFLRQAGSGTITARNQHGYLTVIAIPEV